MLFTVTSPHSTTHFLVADEAYAFARKWSELMTGKFAVWADDLVEAVFRNGARIDK